MDKGTLTIGWVDYWNMLPMRLELQRLWPRELELICGTPRTINRKLSEHEVDVAPSSSICLFTNLSLNMALPLGVACDGRVGSVYLGFTDTQTELANMIVARNEILATVCKEAVVAYGHDLRDLSRCIWQETALIANAKIKPPYIKLSPHSATSNALLHILYYLWFGEESYNYFVSHLRCDEEAQARLLIGNTALQSTSQFARVLDLGEVWKSLTGLPFVFAVWQSCMPLPALWKKRLLKAAELAAAKMRVDPNSYLSLDSLPVDTLEIDLVEYWRRIYYTLKAKELKSLYLFLNLYRLLPGSKVEDESLSARLVRGEELANRVNETEATF